MRKRPSEMRALNAVVIHLRIVAKVESAEDRFKRIHKVRSGNARARMKMKIHDRCES